MDDVAHLLAMFRKKREFWEVLFTLIHVTNLKIIKVSLCMAVEGAIVEGSGLRIVFNDCFRGLNHERNVPHSGNNKALDNKMSDTQRLYQRCITDEAQKCRQKTLVIIIMSTQM